MRLLLVEDEKKLSDLVARALRAESYAVDVAEDGPGGWKPTSTT
jgi:two-component system OmpR family response regulator